MNFIFAVLLTTQAFALEIETDYKTNYQRAGEVESKVLNPQENLHMNAGEQILFQSEDRLPMLVVIPGAKSTQIKLTSDQQKEIVQNATQKVVNQAVADIVSHLQSVEWQIKNKNYAQAESALTELSAKYPHIAVIHFAKGTTYFLMNNKRAAIMNIEAGLALEPQNADAKKLLEKLRRDL